MTISCVEGIYKKYVAIAKKNIQICFLRAAIHPIL